MKCPDCDEKLEFLGGDKQGQRNQESDSIELYWCSKCCKRIRR